jgi:integrase
MPNSQGNGTKPQRHLSVKGAPHVHKSLTKKGWVYEVRHPDRHYETLPGASLAQAKALANKAHATDAPRTVNLTLTFAEAVEDWRATRNIRPSSQKRQDGIVDRHLLPRFRNTRVRDIGPATIERVLVDVPAGSKRLVYKTLRQVLKRAVVLGALGTVPSIENAPKPSDPRKRIISGDEEMRLLAYSVKRGMLSQAIRVGTAQALRIGELCGLEWEDIEWNADGNGNGKMNVRRSVDKDGVVGPTKSGKARRIDLLAPAREALLELRDRCDGTGRIFRNRDGAPWLPGPLGDGFAGAVEDAGIKTSEDGKVTPHAMRHTGISRLANNPRIPIPYVQAFAGHADLATTQGYIHHIENADVLAAANEAVAA